MNAVIKVGGKQYYVTEGSEIFVEKIEGKEILSHYEALQYLQKLGFNVNPVKMLCKNE